MTNLQELTQKCLLNGTTDETCWDWDHGKDKDGYGKVWVVDRTVRTHRVAYETVNGEIPDGLLVLHRCDNPSCWNPAHLFVGTTDDNHKDKKRKGRCNNGRRAKTHCPQGHLYEGDNLVIDPYNSARRCFACVTSQGRVLRVYLPTAPGTLTPLGP